MKAVSVALIVCIGWAALARAESATLGERFEQWAAAHGKHYVTAAERNHRMEVFAANERTYAELNAADGGIFALNEFSDLTEEEFRATHVRKAPVSLTVRQMRATGYVRDIVRSKAMLPEAFDWRDKGAVGPVKNQGACGSCWAFGSVANMEAQWFLNGPTHQLLSLSEQQLVDCSHECLLFPGQTKEWCDLGCGGGYEPTSWNHVIKAGGIMLETAYPYKGRGGACQFDPSKVAAKFRNWTWVTGDEEALREYVFNNGPVSVELAASSWGGYYSGVFDRTCGTDPEHSVDVIGWGVEDGKPFWWIKNSWGRSWGIGGYMKLIRGKNKCNLLQIMSQVIV